MKTYLCEWPGVGMKIPDGLVRMWFFVGCLRLWGAHETPKKRTDRKSPAKFHLDARYVCLLLLLGLAVAGPLDYV